MPLTDQQQKFYQDTLTITRQQIEDLDLQIADTKKKCNDQVQLYELAQIGFRQQYGAACIRLGIPNDLELEENVSPPS